MKDVWIEQGKRSINKKKIIILIIISIIVLALIAGIIVYNVNLNFREWVDINILNKEVYQDNVTTVELNDENAKVYAFGNNIGILSKNKFAIYNNNGNKEKTLDLEITNPIFCSSNRYVGIAENSGQKIYVLEDKKISWDKKVEGQISQLHINRNGYVAAVITGTIDKTVVAIYDNTGNNLFNIYLSSTRLADVCISNDNNFLAIAEVDTSGSIIQSKIKVISIVDPKNTEEKVYNGKANSLITNIKYQDNNNLVCMYDDSIHVISNGKDEVLTDYNNQKISFSSIELNNRVTDIKEESSGLFSADSLVTIIDTNNKSEKTYTVNAVTKEVLTYENVIALNLGSQIEFINTDGALLKRYIAKQEITNMVVSSSVAAIVYRDKVAIISL